MHNLPAAPDIGDSDGATFMLGDGPIVLDWDSGNDLGNCHDQALIDGGIIPDPASVDAELYEVVVEPNADEADLAAAGVPFAVYKVQLPPGFTSVTVPEEYLLAFALFGFTEFKFEVGARIGQNQTFSEGTFQVIVEDDGDGGEDGGGGGGVEGETLGYEWIFPQKIGGTVIEGQLVFVVGPGVELTGAMFGNVNVDVSANNIRLAFTGALPFTMASFNGVVTTDVGDAIPPFSNPSVAAETTIPFDVSRVTVTGNTICIHLGGLAIPAGAVVSINFDVGGI